MVFTKASGSDAKKEAVKTAAKLVKVASQKARWLVNERRAFVSGGPPTSPLPGVRSPPRRRRRAGQPPRPIT
jgi:hypothetical protein